MYIASDFSDVPFQGDERSGGVYLISFLCKHPKLFYINRAESKTSDNFGVEKIKTRFTVC
jgi:hypothetical protein